MVREKIVPKIAREIYRWRKANGFKPDKEGDHYLAEDLFNAYGMEYMGCALRGHSYEFVDKFCKYKKSKGKFR